MARKQVVEINCDRCSKTEHIPPEEVTDEPDFVGKFAGQHVQFDDLCSRCKAAVGNYFSSLIKAKKEEAPEEASPDAGARGDAPRTPTPPEGRTPAASPTTTSPRPTR